jgi:hypothetical protein
MNIVPDNTENAGIVEPYELPVVPEPPLAHAVADVDLSGYQYDIVPTYKMIEDTDDQDTLFRIQFIQAFGITDQEYHPDIVSSMVDYLYDRYNRVPGIRDILESHPLYNAPGSCAAATTTAHDADATPPDSPPHCGHHQNDDISHSFPEGEDNSEMIFCMMFSFQLFDLFHKCLRHAKHGEEIPHTLRDEIKESLRMLF